MKKRSNEKVAHLIRRERMLAVNCTDNSYMVNLSTMKGAEFANEVSYMNVINVIWSAVTIWTEPSASMMGKPENCLQIFRTE